MARILILAPTAIAAITASRGSAIANLLTPDPKEVWADSASGSAATIDIDLGTSRAIDTVFLGYARAPAAAASWTISGGAASYTDSVIKPAGALRVPDRVGAAPTVSHALWHGTAANVRYIRLALTQPAGQPALMAGVVMAGQAFVPSFDKEWGAGRRIIDTGTKTSLPGGGFGTVEGARKGGYSWTLGDLTTAEVDALYDLALDRGETRPVLVVEDPAASTGLRNRIHYGTFDRFRSFERRDPKRSRWELGIEQWV
ncbi:hypothetical protein DFR49_2273 [Hephaestia caeni]|uniref:F5/8 type C domain-containing protein n=1 Tax=Hephaestia caeni TaxID=645617 RepID=A0A397PA31_9SPHN|nr:hypothetical protein [Hephaestia caeni]RIA44037.1 hypothetical protein DFR49_2273 [Hephaestia caeni]